MWKARPKRRRQGGFATVEVLVTIAIVALIGTVAIFALGRTDRAQLNDDVASVALIFQQARLQAAETGRPVEVIYSKDARSIATPREQHDFGRNVSSPTESARIVIRPSGENEGLDLVLVAGDHRRTVGIDWLTGQIRLDP